MKGSTFGDIAIGIIWLAIAATLVSHSGTATDVTAAGNAFSGAIKAAKS